MADYLLGLDNGSTVIKAAIFDTSGMELAVCGEKVQLLTPRAGWYERNMNEIWQANTRAIRAVLNKAGLTGGDIAAVGVTGHGNGLHLVDPNGEPVANAVEGADSRAAGGAFDIDAAGLALGLNDETKFNLIAGTWCNNQYISSTPVIDRDLFMVSRYAIDGYFLVLEGSATSAGNLEWFVSELMGKIGIQTKPGQNIYEFCDQEVEQTSVEDAEIRMGGGAGRSKVWTQIFADALQTPIEITQGTETGALGAAICAGSAA